MLRTRLLFGTAALVLVGAHHSGMDHQCGIQVAPRYVAVVRHPQAASVTSAPLSNASNGKRQLWELIMLSLLLHHCPKLCSVGYWFCCIYQVQAVACVQALLQGIPCWWH